MKYQAEIEGMSAERFRVYAVIPTERKPRLTDHIKRATAGLPRFKRGDKVPHTVAEPVINGTVTGKSVSFDSAGQTISHVVFYKGSVADETVVGSVTVNASGKIEINLVEVQPVEEE